MDKKIGLGLDIGGTKIKAALSEGGNSPIKVGPEVKIAAASNAVQLFQLLNEAIQAEWKMTIGDFDWISIAGAGTWDAASGRLLHAEEYYAGVLDIQAAMSALGVEMSKVKVFNDFEAQARAAQGAPGQNAKVILPGSGREGSIIVVGPGTGLGEAILVWDGKKHFLLRSEGGNAPLVAAFDWQGPILTWLTNALRRPVIIEDLLSGGGYLALAQAMIELHMDEEDIFIDGFDFVEEDNSILFAENLTPQKLDEAVREGKAPALKKAFGVFLGLELRNLVMKFWNAGRIVLTGGVLSKCPELIDGNVDFELALRSPHLLVSEHDRQSGGWRNVPVPQDTNIGEVEVVHMFDPDAGAIGACICGIAAMEE